MIGEIKRVKFTTDQAAVTAHASRRTYDRPESHERVCEYIMTSQLRECVGGGLDVG